MIRKIATISTSLFGAFALTFAPQIASAQTVSVTATVAAATTINSNTDVATTTWTGAAALAAPFTVTVTSNSGTGYSFTFSDTAATGTTAFVATGGVSGVLVDFTVTDATPYTYVEGTVGTPSYAQTNDAAVATTFDVNWPVQANVPADTYTDSLTVTATPTVAT